MTFRPASAVVDILYVAPTVTLLSLLTSSLQWNQERSNRKSLGQVHTTHSRTQIGIPLTNTMEGTLQPILRLTTAHTTSTTMRPSALTPVASQGSTRAQTRGTLDAPSLGFNRLQRKSCTPRRKGRRGRQQAVQTGLWESGRFPARRRRSRSVLRVLVIQCRIFARNACLTIRLGH